MHKMDKTTIKHILVEYQLDIPRYAWKEKEKVIFRLKAKYGDSFNTKMASEIYDEIVNTHVETEVEYEDIVEVELWDEPKRIKGNR